MEQKKRGCGGCVFPILVVIGIVLIGSLISFTIKNDGKNPNSSYSSGYNSDITDVKLEDASEYNYYYDYLSSGEKETYDVALAAVQNREASFDIPASSGVDTQHEYQKIIRALIYDHPEFYWITNGFKYNSSQIFFTFFEFWEYSSDSSKHISELETAVDNVAKLAKKNSKDKYEMVKFVHDYLVDTAEYDYDTLEEYKSANHSASSGYIFTAYGCLINHSTVCAGYAKAYQMILNRLGIPCVYVVGKAGENHAWNRVIIDGESYYVDVTWDDRPIDEKQYTEYSYFNFTTEELQKTRTIEEYFDQPNCTSKKYDFYVHNDYMIDNYSIDAVKSVISLQRSNPAIYIKFKNYNDFAQAFNDWKSGKWSNIKGYNGVKDMCPDEKMLTMMLYK